MRLMTANLYNGRAEVSALNALLEELQPDLLVAQEVGFDAAELLERVFAHGVVEGADDCSGTAMVAQFPIDVEQLDLEGRSGVSTNLTAGAGHTTAIFGIHLSNPVDGLGSIRARARQVDTLSRLTSGIDRLVILGDCNATPIWPTYRRLVRSFDDGVAEWASRLGETPKRTWSARPGTPPLLRIDHVFTRGLSLDAVRVDVLAGSDHKTLTVDADLTGASK